jgi:Skp family chaperone for outer membrane proteins
MLSRRIIREMLIAVGVAGGVVAVATIGLIAAAPTLLKPAPPVPQQAATVSGQTCTMDRKAVFELTKISRDAYEQFAVLQKQMQAGIIAEKNRIDAGELDPAKTQQLVTQLQQRLAKENARLEAVRGAALAMVIKRISPVVATVGEAANCNSVLDRASFVYVGHTKDLTAEIVRLVERDIPLLEPGLIAELYRKQK